MRYLHEPKTRRKQKKVSVRCVADTAVSSFVKFFQPQMAKMLKRLTVTWERETRSCPKTYLRIFFLLLNDHIPPGTSAILK